MAVSPEEIRRHCLPKVFERARLIAAAPGSISGARVSYDGDDANLSAFVASSSGWGDGYRSSVSVDERGGAVADYVCTCPAYREYAGMCKHCAALALTYLERPASFRGFDPDRRAGRTETSRGLREVVALFERRERAQASGKVDVLPALRCEFGAWSASFKLEGPAGTYVMKSIGEFVGLMARAEEHSYGKNLSFAHIPENLTPRGARIARFLARQLSARAAAAYRAFGMRGSATASAGRSIELTEDAVAELLDALGCSDLVVETSGVGLPASASYRVEDADPPLRLEFFEHGSGYRLELPEGFLFLRGGTSLYAIGSGTVYRCSEALDPIAPFLTFLPPGETVVDMAARDAAAFCASVLPRLEEAAPTTVPRSMDALRPVPCRLRFYLDREGQLVTCEAFAVYGERRFILASFRETDDDSASEDPAPLRDEAAEARATELLSRFFDPANARIDLRDDQAVGSLLFEGIAQMRQMGEVFTTAAFDRLVREGAPKMTVGVSLSGNLLQLDVQASDLGRDELAALLASYRKRRRYHRLRDGSYLDVGQLDLAQLERIAANVGLTPRQLAAGAEVPCYRAFCLDAEENLLRHESFEAYLARLRRPPRDEWPAPEPLTKVLRPYQAEGFAWLSARAEAGFGGILADEMGLGKSVQLIALLLDRRLRGAAERPSLIVCPASLVYQWVDELARFAPQLSAAACLGPREARLRMLAALRRGEGPAVLVTSYDSLRADAAEYEALSFDVVALDEAQHIKNPATLTARSCRHLRADHRFALTGTPVENRLSELWSIFDFLMPGFLGSYEGFRKHFEEPVVGGDEEAAQRLRALVGPFVCRRRKRDVLSELPGKLESTVLARFGDDQRALYDAHEQRLRDLLTAQKNESASRSGKPAGGQGAERVQVLAELTRLRQLCCDPTLVYEDYRGGSAKTDAVVELALSAADSGEKVLVFSQFTSFLDIIGRRLSAEGAAFYSITGRTPAKERLELVNRFNADDVPVFLVSLKAGGTGLNLTGASVVIHADPWWNAAAQSQATDRAHRIGQDRVVSVVKVIAKGTVEERIAKLQEAKARLADQVVAAGSRPLSALSPEALLELLEG